MNPTVDTVKPHPPYYVDRLTRRPKIEIYVQYKKPRAKVLVSLALDDIDSGTDLGLPDAHSPTSRTLAYVPRLRQRGQTRRTSSRQARNGSREQTRSRAQTDSEPGPLPQGAHARQYATSVARDMRRVRRTNPRDG